jgi:hypothetical protein
VGTTLYAVLGRRWRHLVLQPPARTLWQVCLVNGVVLSSVTVLLMQTALASAPLAAATLALLPFLGAGLFLALMFTVAADQSRLLYAANLLGAGIGCLASLLALYGLGAENTLALAALSFLTTAALMALTIASGALALEPVVYATAADNSLSTKTRYNALIALSSARALPWFRPSFSTNSDPSLWWASS